MQEVRKGQLYYVDLGTGVGSEQNGTRPCLIIQNDKGNKHSPTTIIAIGTTKKQKSHLPTHYWLSGDCGTPKDTMIECEQVRVIDKARLGDYIGTINNKDMQEINKCLKVSFEL